MPGAAARPYLASADIKLEYGVPQTFALKFKEGKSVESRFPGGRVMFTAIDDRKLFLDDEDANDLERAMYGLSIGVADFMRVTKIRHPRGGGHSIRVERVEEREDPGTLAVPRAQPDADPGTRRAARIAAAPSRIEAQLEKSLHMARESGPAAFIAPAPEHQAAVTAASVNFVAAYMTAIDVLIEAKAYAQRKGLAIEVRCEDVRCLAATLVIQGRS
jgi:hypothetical protein